MMVGQELLVQLFILDGEAVTKSLFGLNHHPFTKLCQFLTDIFQIGPNRPIRTGQVVRQFLAGHITTAILRQIVQNHFFFLI